MNHTQIDSTGRWVLVATIAASSMAFIMQGALNVALPAIQADLGAEGADLLWIVNAFQLLLGALILVGGSLGDHYGRKRIYIIGIAIFAVGSTMCGVAPSTPVLIASRAVQGVGGALMVPGSLAILSAYFNGKARGQAIGIWSSFTTMTSVAGPLLGGVLADAGLWRMVFFINLPLAALSLWALFRYVPESKDEEAAKRLDFIGAGLVMLGLAGVVFGATELGRQASGQTGLGLSSPVLAGIIALGVIALGMFWWYEGRTKQPMLSLKLFQSRTFTGTNLMTLFLYGALGGALFFFPLNLVQVQGYRATIAGLAFLPFSVLLILMSPYMGGLIERIGARLPLTIGPVIVGAGFAALALPGITGGEADYFTTYFPGVVLIGFGMGVVVAPLTTTVMGSVPQHNSGIASGVNNAMSRVAGVLAVAILGGIALSIFSSTLEADAAVSSLPDDDRAALMAAAGDLGNTAIPETIPEQSAVQQAVDDSFIATFRVIMLIAAGMCFLSAGLAWWLVEGKPADDAEGG